MKILINATCATSGRPTGIERYALHLACELTHIDSSTSVVASVEIDGVSENVKSAVLRIADVLLGRYEYVVRALWDQTALRLLISKIKPDVVFFPIQDGLFFPPVKQIVTVHDLHYLHFDASIPDCRREINSLRTAYYKKKMPHVINNSAAVVTVSESTKSDIVASFGVPPEKIHVIYNGYDAGRFKRISNPQPILGQYGLDEGGYVLYVGSILKHKNLLRILRAFAASKAQDLSMVVIGVCKDRNYLEEIYHELRVLHISAERFRYLESVPDQELPYFYCGAKMFVLPSLHEGFGVPIIEAMACGTPVITSNCSAMPEVAGNAALLVDPYSVENIATAMNILLNDHEQREKLIQAGNERVKLFSWSNSAKKLYDLCKRINAL